MENKRVLIAYGTRSGATEEIAQEIAKTLNEKGLKTQILNLGDTKTKHWQCADDFEGILIGTSLRINKWKKEVKSFISKNIKELEDETKKLGFFTCSGEGASNPDKARDAILTRLMDEFGIKPDIHDAFGGLIDLSEDSNLSGITKKMLRMAAPEMESDGIKLDLEGRNDFRDWDQIHSFVEDFAAML